MSLFPTDDRFFGDDSRTVAQIVTRRHPLAFAVYSVVFLLGCVFVFHAYGPHTESELFPGISRWWIAAWKWMMVSGGLGAMVCLSTKPRTDGHWPDLADLLHLEGIAAIVAGFGLLTYTVAIVDLTGFADARPALLIYGALILGHVWRGWQAISDGRRLEVLAERYQDIEGEDHGD